MSAEAGLAAIATREESTTDNNVNNLNTLFFIISKSPVTVVYCYKYLRIASI